MRKMKIGDMACDVRCSIQTIRFYERKGLLPALTRTEGNYRVYDDEALARLVFIRQCRTLDISIEEIRQLLMIRASPQHSCEGISKLINAHLIQVEQRISELQALHKALRQMAESCSADTTVEDCEILKTLRR